MPVAFLAGGCNEPWDGGGGNAFFASAGEGVAAALRESTRRLCLAACNVLALLLVYYAVTKVVLPIWSSPGAPFAAVFGPGACSSSSSGSLLRQHDDGHASGSSDAGGLNGGLLWRALVWWVSGVWMVLRLLGRGAQLGITREVCNLLREVCGGGVSGLPGLAADCRLMFEPPPLA
jgi:hypothetical protein